MERGYNRIKLKDFEHCSELAEVKISYIGKTPWGEKINKSADVFQILFDLYDKDTIELKEEFFVIFLNRSNRYLGWIKLSSGGSSGTVVDVKIIYALALLTNAHSFIISHNHPSGNINPSEADIGITKKVKEAGKLMEITLFDHIIVSPDGRYYSFADEGTI